MNICHVQPLESPWEWSSVGGDRLRGWGWVCSGGFLLTAVAGAVTKGSE